MNYPQPLQSLGTDLLTLLGITDADEPTRAQFTSQFIDTIWSEVVDATLLEDLTDAHLERFETIMGDAKLTPEETKAQLYALLQEVVPNLQQRLMDRAKEMKLELMQARIGGMREFCKDDVAKVAKIDEAEKQVGMGQVGSAAQILNALSPASAAQA